MEEKIDMTVEEVKDFTEEELADETVDWKAKAQESLGIAKRRTTQLGKAKSYISELETKIPKAPEPQDKIDKSQPKEFDYGQKAFLIANGIKTEEFDFVKSVIAATGKSLDDVIVSKYFQAELKEKRDAEAVKNATPSDTKRTAPSINSTVDYWLEKGEYPPNTPENRKLRQEVQAAKETRAKTQPK
jgi:hypothetical protein